MFTFFFVCEFLGDLCFLYPQILLFFCYIFYRHGYMYALARLHMCVCVCVCVALAKSSCASFSCLFLFLFPMFCFVSFCFVWLVVCALFVLLVFLHLLFLLLLYHFANILKTSFNTCFFLFSSSPQFQNSNIVRLSDFAGLSHCFSVAKNIFLKNLRFILLWFMFLVIP